MKKWMIGALIMTCTLMPLAGCAKKAGATQEKAPAHVTINESQKETSEAPSALTEPITNKNYGHYVTTKDIKTDPASISKEAGKYYTKYISYMAPNGKAINILAQDKVKDEQLLYAYGLLDFYLKNLEKRGTNIANQMANNQATLVMPNGADGDAKGEDFLIGQPQYQNETANIGSKWYIENDYSHRDSAFEEIFHLVHGQGIGQEKNPQADNDLAKAITKGRINALPKDQKDWGTKGLWGLGAKESLLEWSSESPASLDAEYIICVIDSYYGMWENFDGKGALYDEYIAKSRQGAKEKDPLGYSILESFLPKAIDSMLRVDDTFKGTFKMALDETLPYTKKSQYLKNLSLTGQENSNLTGNALDNILMGNSGQNILDGQDGKDVLQLRGPFKDYQLTKASNGDLIIEDQKANRDGKNTIKNIETLRFTDQDVPADQIK